MCIAFREISSVVQCTVWYPEWTDASRDPNTVRDKDAMLKIQAAQAVNRNISAPYFNQSCIDTYKSEICAPYNSGDHLDR